ncbi:hypothetical protein DSO57_1010161 [Entomophthora muscae]|uniref:Uncharacterized protein n=1 Tax=Entomophthora muscae TaxID=34485 RepID=A0ACC2UGE7_9FUNG|nr:hypothetical protein DSO57_1010161 [Entomophthora muscae]
MVFNSNIFNSASSQASFNGGEAQNVEAPVYTQAFEAGNKEADLLLTPNPYGFDLFSNHLVSSSSPAPVPTPAQAAHQPTNQDGNLDLEQLPATSQPAPPTANQASAPLAQRPKQQIITAKILQEIVALNLQGLSWEQITAQLQFTQATVMREFNNLIKRGVVNRAINAILICPLNIDSCKDLPGFAFEFGNSLPSANGSGSISTHSRLLYLFVVDPGMTSSQRDPLSHSVFLLSDHCPLSTI